MWHPSHEHVLFEQSYHLLVDRLSDRRSPFEAFSYHLQSLVLSHGPQELLEVHGTHLHSVLFGRYEDGGRLGHYRDEGSGFDVIVSAVFHQMFDELSRTEIVLDLVEDDQGLPLIQFCAVDGRQAAEQKVEVAVVLLEGVDDIVVREIHYDVALVFVPAELLGDEGLADTARTLDQERGFPVSFFPLKEFCVDLPLHRHIWISSGIDIILTIYKVMFPGLITKNIVINRLFLTKNRVMKPEIFTKNKVTNR